MSKYNIHHTNKNLPTIDIDEENLDNSTDLTLFGRRRLKYGEQMNENILHLLEHFSCPESGTTPNTPDLNIAAKDKLSGIKYLSQPVNGQLWYNSTQDCLFFWESGSSKWLPLGMQEDIAANWGVIYTGEKLPKPISTTSGRVFEYSECSWIVSPYIFPTETDIMQCTTDEYATVLSYYTVEGDPTLIPAFATYLIVGIRGNINLGSLNPIPSPTPTVTPSVTENLTPTPTPAVTPTPSNLPYSGPLFAYSDGSKYANPGVTLVDGFYSGDEKSIPYPNISTERYQIVNTSPATPYAKPWEPVSGKYYVYIRSTAFDSPFTAYPYTENLKNKLIFFSNDGVNGLFYKINSISTVSGGLLRIEINTSQSGFTIGGYYNRIPINPALTASIDQLRFTYQYAYYVEAYFLNYSPANPHVSKLYFTPPTPYEKTVDLFITGGKPPYFIDDILPAGGDECKIVCVTGSGFSQEYFPASKVNLLDIASIKSKFVGVVSTANPNITNIPNGFKISKFMTLDIYYDNNYSTVYGVGCAPEYRWHYSYSQGAIIENNSCATYTGSSTSGVNTLALVRVIDSEGTVILAPLNINWQLQTPDYKFPNTDMGFTASITGIDPGNIITTAGTYTWNIGLDVANPSSSVQPINKFGSLQYMFSMIKQFDTSTSGGWDYLGDTLATIKSGGGNRFNFNAALVHVGDNAIFPTNQLIPFNGSTGSIQQIAITSYRATDGTIVNIAANPIYVRFYPTSTSNTFIWNSLKPDGTNNSLSESSPLVPYDMKLDVVIPAGLPKSGSLIIGLAIVCFDANNNGYGLGNDGGVYTVQLNFSTT